MDYKAAKSYFDYVVVGETCFTDFCLTTEVPMQSLRLATEMAEIMKADGFVDVKVIDIRGE